MRIDKFLKVSRILKRRTIAKELADNDRILVNGKIAKPSSEVNVKDLITVIFGQRRLTVQVESTREYAKKEDAPLMYTVIEEKFGE